MRKINFLCIATIVMLLGGCTAQTEKKEGANTPEVKNVIFMIGDGMGLSQVYAGMTVAGNLALEQCTHTGFSKTYSSSSYITDSAAGGTALASGSKTNNGMIGIAPDSTTHLYSILSAFEAVQRPTGLVVTVPITHATPAAFYAHQVSRKMYEEIAMDLLYADVDLFIGGGKIHFDGRSDGLNLIDSLRTRDYRVDFSIDSVKAPVLLPYAALTAEMDMEKASVRGNFLPKAVDLAIKSLNAKNSGFFLMVEGSQIDYYCHNNDQQGVIDEMLDFDRAVAEAIEFAKADGNTLVVITADHETGGMTVVEGSHEEHTIKATFNTDGHTGCMVPIYAYGPGAEHFTGIMENTQLQKIMLELVGIAPVK